MESLVRTKIAYQPNWHLYHYPKTQTINFLCILYGQVYFL
jgi:hypothetical protein